MSKRDVTCDDCYFRQRGLCALALERPCPTFRQHQRQLVPPPQARLLSHALETVAAGQEAA